MRGRIARAATALLAVTTGIVAAAVVPAPASAGVPGPALALPAPTGPYRVGVTDLHLVDTARADPWVPQQRRELMVSLWFPAASGGGTPDQYLSPQESRLLLQPYESVNVPLESLSQVRVHARQGVRALPQRGGRPLVVLSPGFSYPRSSLTALAEDLASRGYVVAGVDHTYEAPAVTFPDGRIAECTACPLVYGDQVAPEQVTSGRAADVSFVLDSLTGRYRPAALTRTGVRIDSSRVAMVGHSNGGSSAAETMLRDRRVDAGANLDGTFFPPVTTRLDRPFLLMSSEKHGQPGNDATWDTTWRNLGGWRRWVTVNGASHASYTDYAILGPQVGVPVQSLPGERFVEVTRQYVGAFADRHLRHRRAPLLEGPSTRYPEVIFHRP